MTTPQRPADPPLPVEPGWDDERLAAAFAARAARVVVPVDLVAATTDRLRPAATARPWWRRLLPAGAIAVLLVAVIGGGIALVGGPAGLLGGASGVSFRDGPTPDLRTLDAGTFALDFPADWHGYDATGPYQGTSLAVLSSLPIPCGSGDRIDITCVYERPLEPGEARIIVGVLSYRSGTILDRPSAIENGRTTHVSIGGMPAILDERDKAPDDFYRADDSATWSIGTPESLSRAVQLDFQAREPEVDAARRAAEAIAASFRFTPPPTPLPDDPAAAVAAARAVLDAEAAAFRQGFVPADDSDGQTYLGCLPEAPGEDRVVGIDYGPGGALGWTVLTRCRWTVEADERGPFWRIDAVYEWTAGDAFGRYRESYWIDAAGVVIARTNSGDVPPAGDPTATPEPPATPAPSPTAPAWGPWPPDGAEVIELPNDDPNEPALVAVVDLSGTLTEVRAPTAQDGQPGGPDEAFFRDPSGDGRYRLRWGTTICDREMTVTIDAEVDRIVIDHAPRDGCDAMGIGRELVLEFSGDVDPASVELVVNRAVLLPEAPPEPTVMTVPLGRGGTIDWIVVTDHTGSLMEALPAALDGVPATHRFAPGPQIVQAADGGTVVLWDGGMCDSDFSITIEADQPGPPDRITIRHAEAGVCRLALIRRAVWLDLGPVDVDSIDLRREVVAVPSVPDALFGLEVIDVEEALQIRALPDDDREIAVAGLHRTTGAIIDCDPVEGTSALFYGDCAGRGPWFSSFDWSTEMVVRIGPNTSFTSMNGAREPAVLIGHFDDRRASGCQVVLETACEDVFVVDRVWVYGEVLPRDWVAPATFQPDPRHTHDGAWARVQGPGEAPLVPLSVGLVPFSLLRTLEPSTVGLVPAETWNWLVVAYEPSSRRSRTFVIPDSVLANDEGVVSYEVVVDGVVTSFSSND